MGQVTRWRLWCRACKTAEQVIVAKTRPDAICLLCGKPLAVQRLGHREKR